jgi:hypothetical protein
MLIRVWDKKRIHFNGKKSDGMRKLQRGGMIILKWIFQKWDARVWTGLNWFETVSIGRLF